MGTIRQCVSNLGHMYHMAMIAHVTTGKILHDLEYVRKREWETLHNVACSLETALWPEIDLRVCFFLSNLLGQDFTKSCPRQFWCFERARACVICMCSLDGHRLFVFRRSADPPLWLSLQALQAVAYQKVSP